MLTATVAQLERLRDEKTGDYLEVYVIQLKLGSNSWSVRRRYEGFLALDGLLRANCPQEFTNDWASALPHAPPSGEKSVLVKTFLSHLTQSPKLLSESPTRQFFEVPLSRALNTSDSTSIMSETIEGAARRCGAELPKWFPKRLELSDALALLLIVLFSPVVMLPPGKLFPIQLTRLSCAFVLPMMIWYLTRGQGLVFVAWTRLLERVVVPPRTIRGLHPTDQSSLSMLIGVLIGLCMGAAESSIWFFLAMLATRLSFIVAVANLFFLHLGSLSKMKA